MMSFNECVIANHPHHKGVCTGDARRLLSETSRESARRAAREAGWRRDQRMCKTESDFVRFTRLCLWRRPTKEELAGWRDAR